MVLRSFKKKIREHFEKVIETKTSPKSIASGFALGTFIAILPTPGLSILIGLGLLLIFKNMNKYAMLGAFLIWNPVIQVPLYILSFKIGGLIFGSEPVVSYNVEILNQIHNFSRRFLIGNLIVSSITSIISYFVIYFLSKGYYKSQK